MKSPKPDIWPYFLDFVYGTIGFLVVVIFVVVVTGV